MIEQHMSTTGTTVRVGGFRGEGPGPFEPTLHSYKPCPLCGDRLYLFTGYTERVIIKAVCKKHKECAIVEDIPVSHEILSCKRCCQTFTSPV